MTLRADAAPPAGERQCPIAAIFEPVGARVGQWRRIALGAMQSGSEAGGGRMNAKDRAGRRPIRAACAAGMMLAGAAGALAPSAAAAQADVQAIVPDATVSGTISESDPEIGDRHYDSYRVR